VTGGGQGRKVAALHERGDRWGRSARARKAAMAFFLQYLLIIIISDAEAWSLSGTNTGRGLSNRRRRPSVTSPFWALCVSACSSPYYID